LIVRCVGYAGRVELPENLKAMFRSVAMMVPDREIIIKVKLASVGYMDFAILAKKFRVLYNLCEEQLSKQRHYDFGLRNILSVLRTAGINLRLELAKDSSQDRSNLEEMLMMRTLRDMNLSKLVADDVDLFISLLHDLFPNQKDPEKRRYDAEEEAMRQVIEDMKLVHHDSWVNKIIQLYETSLVRHGLMMVGPAGSGKTMATRVLIDALTMTHEKHLLVRMNPKAIKSEEMFGENDLISGEWTHGVFSSIWQKFNDVKKHNTWIVCDGPVDAIWIENLNSVLDDNKLLTLANGDRLPMTDNVRLLFEVQDLRNASPATVSRAGIIFVSSNDLGYEPIVTAWLNSRREDEALMLKQLYQKYFVQADLMQWLARNTRNVMKSSEVHLVTNCLNLLEGLLLDSEGGEGKQFTIDQLERFLLYSLIWSLGSLLEADDRSKFSSILSEIASSNWPAAIEEYETLYDYYVDEESLDWARWEAPEWEYKPESFNFSTCLIPTVDSVRAEYLIDTLLDKLHKPVLIVGSSGTAKTSIILQYTNSFDNSKMLLKKVNFSSATTAGMFQQSMEADIEKRQGKTYAPAGGRWMTVFLDDLSMPEVNNWGDQPTLELVRQLIETGGFYFLEKDKRGDKKVLENILYIGAMSHPGGGRNDVPDRLKRHFFCFNMTPPSQASIDNIYGSMLRGRFEDHNSLANLVQPITNATIELWLAVRAKMLPTPSKFHYVFNMRDLARVFQGILFSPLDVLAKSSTGHTLVSLWRHECERVFGDKLTNFKDKKWLEEELFRVTAENFGDQIATEFSELKQPIYFVDFLRDEIVDEETEEVLEDAPKIYELVPSIPDLRSRVENYLSAYNSQSGVKPMDLVLFDDALEHMMRISRIIGRPRGNALLVGVGGSGRQSLTRLAAYIAHQDVFQITITRAYKMNDFLEDLRKLYIAVGKEGRKTTWILTDFDIINEEFLEYINAVLTTGEVAGLFPKDERDMMCSDLRIPARKENKDFIDTPDNLYRYFIDRIRDNLHIVLCFSPANEKFAERARRFPGLISGCTVDWFLRWPEQALVDVSFKFLTEDKDFKVEADSKVEKQLVRHIATVHNLVTEACDEYFQKFRRNVYVTPKSYLSYIKSYKLVYKQKLEAIQQQQRNVETGLKKLKEAEIDVGKLQLVLEQQNIDLGEADRAASQMLAKLEIGAKEANVKKQAADVIEAKCTRTANQIDEEKKIANKELEAAMPFVRAAEKAARSINKKDMTVIQKLGKPPDLIKRIMDCVLILNLRPLEPVEMTEIKTGKNEFEMFIKDSYDTYAKKFMFEAGFIKNLLDFATEEKDNINEETMEFLEPYVSVTDFNEVRARTVSSAAEGLLKWVKAMHSYHMASLVVGPKLEQLMIKTNLFAVASAKLKAAKDASKAAQDEVDRLQEQFSATMREKAALEQQARDTQDKMIAANNLIRSLAGEKKRWQADALVFAEDKKKLVGNCALACAFASYLGPFNHEFRRKLLVEHFLKDCIQSGIPVTKELDLNKFLVDDATIAEWNSQGLPKDELSIQNGILVTQASRYPLLIDPQGQAMTWLRKREANSFPIWGTTTLTNPKLRDQLEFCMENGLPLLIEGIVKDVDPMLDGVLEKNIFTRGRSFYVMIGDKQCSIDPKFRLYLVTKLANPIFSPELSAKTTIIDFSVTQKGLEDQLLSRVIQSEQRSLEDQRSKLIEEVNLNTISLQSLDKQLLERLSASQGNLLDDSALISVLADTKAKAQEVKEKIEASYTTEQIINKRREHYRPVATRGSVIYFVIVSMAQVNCMYQTSLAQFLNWFDGSMVDAEKANLVAKRVEILMKHLTFEVYININRGLFEVDKLTFKLMITLKVLVTETQENGQALDERAQRVLLRGGAGVNLETVPKKPFDWLQHGAYLNMIALANNVEFFSDIKQSLEQNEYDWRKWYESEAPEALEIPRLEDRLQSHPHGSFLRFLLVRSFRDDRTRLAANNFIGSVLGDKYTEPVPTRLEDIWRVSDSNTPVILLLTPGADPTSQLEELAKKKGIKLYPVSMGEGQEPYAQRSMNSGIEEGAWSLLQNCHLGLGFMEQIEEKLSKAHEHKVDSNFRLWITCEPHEDFPISLLQMSIKVTNEPPRGMKAGLLRSYNSVVDAERLGRVETKEWRDLVFGLCFLHSTVQERRKFGPVGWCIPYEFNTFDLEASLTFLEKHCFANAGLSWPTVRYMICQVQYGGRITDDQDRILFETFGKLWLNPEVFKEDFTFSTAGAFKYQVPSCDNIDGYRKYIAEFPSHDNPEIFGLHSNADLTFGSHEATYILNTIAETQPKEAGAKAGGKTREEIVYERAEELLQIIPRSYVDEEVRDSIRKRSKLENEFVLGPQDSSVDLKKIDGFSIPLNIFLYQEISRLNRTINNVRQTLQDLKSAINGEIIMTPELQLALNFVFNEKPPKHWYVDASGMEIAWYLPSLALWFGGLIDREKQLTQWLNTTRPVTYWLTGFFNPQGFLTATRQEITRRHTAERWALDDVVLVSQVTENVDVRKIKYPPQEGVYIHGLYLEGASWDRREGKLVESHPKELFTPLPVMLVTAVTSKQAEKQYAAREDNRWFDCPVYRDPKRTGRSYVFTVKLKTNVDPDHWTLRGVALLCSKD
jgi:dynein heavy chain